MQGVPSVCVVWPGLLADEYVEPPRAKVGHAAGDELKGGIARRCRQLCPRRFERALRHIEADVSADVVARAQDLAQQPSADAVVADARAAQRDAPRPAEQPVALPPAQERLLAAAKVLRVVDVRAVPVHMIPVGIRRGGVGRQRV